MDKEVPSFNIWGEISDSELVLEAVKVEQKYEKRQEKCHLAQWFSDKTKNTDRKLKINVIVNNKSTTICHGLPSYRP